MGHRLAGLATPHVIDHAGTPGCRVAACSVRPNSASASIEVMPIIRRFPIRFAWSKSTRSQPPATGVSMTVDAIAAARSRLRSASPWAAPPPQQKDHRGRRHDVPGKHCSAQPDQSIGPGEPEQRQQTPASVTPSASRAAMRGPRTSSRANRASRPTSCSPAASCATASTTRHPASAWIRSPTRS